MNRRQMLAACAATLAAFPATLLGAKQVPHTFLVEVEGYAPISSASDRASAPRRSLADAILAAAIAGGAAVRGHSVLTSARMTSDVLMVAVLGQVHGFSVISQQCAADGCRTRLRALVGPLEEGACPSRRYLSVVVTEPVVKVAPDTPAWAAALAQSLSVELVELVEKLPQVESLQRIGRETPTTKIGSRYLDALGRQPHIDAASHLLDLELGLQIVGHEVELEVTARLLGPAGEELMEVHRSRIDAPAPSVLGRAEVLVRDRRSQLAKNLTGGAGPALSNLLTRAGCRPSLSVLSREGGKLVATAGRRHGLRDGGLAITVDGQGFPDMLEIVRLGANRSELRPLDTSRSAAEFVGRTVRFVSSDEGFP